MRKIYIIIFILTVIAVAGHVWPRRNDYHDFAGKCLNCHLNAPEDGSGPGIFLQDISSLCLDCHTETKDLSHPVDRRPSMKLPVNFPLDWKNEITCVTCHFAHIDGYGEFHLRSRAGGAGFCVTCHSDYEQDTHQSSLGSAHIVGDSTRRYIALEDDRALDNLEMDDLSLRCLSCHDALFATDSEVETRQSALGFYHNENGIGLSHPIGVSYMDAKRRYRGAYRNPENLPPQIRFFNGMVGCGTCHNPYAKDKHAQLVIGNYGSRLCLACHVK